MTSFTEMIEQGRHFIPFGILAISAMGSAHCVAMCGPLSVAFTRSHKDSISYHLSRLFAYVTIAVGIFSFKENLIQSEAWKQVAKYSEVLILISLAILALSLLKSSLLPSKSKIGSTFFRKLGNFLNKKNLLKPGIIGFLNGFIPCGWLYSFFVVISLSPDLFSSILWTVSFWLPNFLVLLLIQNGVALGKVWKQKYLKVAMACLLVLFVGHRLSKFHWNLNLPGQAEASMQDKHSCH